jgi:S1/P1 Nuclease
MRMRVEARKSSAVFLVVVFLLTTGPAAAWGDLGHEVTALIAYRHLTVKARDALDALLASDSDALTAADFASRTTWADKYRNTHRETAAWHFIDIEIDGVAVDKVANDRVALAQADLAAACFGLQPLAAGQAASAGPAQDCIVNKINEFFVELKNPATPPAERLLALKFLIHFIGDLHQPLHTADHEDRGGNCIALSPSPDGHDNNLHAFWDVGAVEALGHGAPQIAAALDAQITMGDMQAWNLGDTNAWTMESFALGRKDVYALSRPTASLPTCQAPGSIALSAEYQAQAAQDAALQLKRAGIRMAGLLNNALDAQ